MNSLSRATQTKLVGGLIVLVMVLGGWFFLVHPQLAKQGTIASQVSDEQSKADTLQGQIAALQKKQQDLPNEQAIAAAQAARFPGTADQPGLFTEINAAAAQAGINPNQLSAITPGIPTLVAAAAPAPAPASTSTDGTATGSTSTTGTTSTTTTGGVSLGSTTSNLATMTVAVTVTGNSTELVKFLHNLENMKRSYLISEASFAYAVDGKSSTTLNITGTMFVMAQPKTPNVALLPKPSGSSTPTTTPGSGSPTGAPGSGTPSPTASPTSAAPGTTPASGGHLASDLNRAQSLHQEQVSSANKTMYLQIGAGLLVLVLIAGFVLWRRERSRKAH